MQTLILIVLLTLGQSSAMAKNSDSLPCAFTAWPFKDTDVSSKASLQALNKKPRKFVRQYYFYEITSPKMRPKLAKGLLDFLLSVEPQEEVRSFLELTGLGADLSEAKPHPISRDELCELAKKVSLKTTE